MMHDYRRFRSALLTGLGTSLFFLAAVFLTYACGLIPETAPAASRQAQLTRMARASTYEGVFLARDGVTPLTEAESPGRAGRILYPSLSRLIGYSSSLYGQSGMRQRWHQELYTGGSDDRGCSIVTTLDPVLSELCYSLMADWTDAAAVVTDAASGEVLACVSRAGGLEFDANAISRNQTEVFEAYNRVEGFFLDPALAASQAGGSTTKLITAALVLQQGLEQNYLDTGREPAGSSYVQNYGGQALGPLDLKQAVVLSSNCYFAHQALSVPPETLLAQFRAFGYEQDIPLEDLSTRIRQRLDPAAQAAAPETLARIGFGYSIATSPLMAAVQYQSLITGCMRTPCFVKAVIQDGETLYTAPVSLLSEPIPDPDQRAVLQEIFAAAAESYGLQSSRFKVMAKTGTSENSAGSSNHLWMAAALLDPETGAGYTLCIVRFNAPDGLSSHSLAQQANQIIACLDASSSQPAEEKEEL